MANPRAILNVFSTKSRQAIDISFNNPRGPGHAPVHECTVTVGSLVRCQSSAGNKKTAMQEACKGAVDELRRLGHIGPDGSMKGSKGPVMHPASSMRGRPPGPQLPPPHPPQHNYPYYSDQHYQQPSDFAGYYEGHARFPQRQRTQPPPAPPPASHAPQPHQHHHYEPPQPQPPASAADTYRAPYHHPEHHPQHEQQRPPGPRGPHAVASGGYEAPGRGRGPSSLLPPPQQHQRGPHPHQHQLHQPAYGYGREAATTTAPPPPSSTMRQPHLAQAPTSYTATSAPTTSQPAPVKQEPSAGPPAHSLPPGGPRRLPPDASGPSLQAQQSPSTSTTAGGSAYMQTAVVSADDPGMNVESDDNDDDVDDDGDHVMTHSPLYKTRARRRRRWGPELKQPKIPSSTITAEPPAPSAAVSYASSSAADSAISTPRPARRGVPSQQQQYEEQFYQHPPPAHSMYAAYPYDDAPYTQQQYPYHHGHYPPPPQPPHPPPSRYGPPPPRAQQPPQQEQPPVQWSGARVQPWRPPRVPSAMQRNKTAKSLIMEYCQALKYNKPHVDVMRSGPQQSSAFTAWLYVDWLDQPTIFQGHAKRKKDAEHSAMEQLLTYMLDNSIISETTGKPPPRRSTDVTPRVYLDDHLAHLLDEAVTAVEAALHNTPPTAGMKPTTAEDWPQLVPSHAPSKAAPMQPARKKAGREAGEVLLPEQMDAPAYLTRDLPAFNHRIEVLGALAKESAVVVAGSTGTGKTTQIPQYLLEDFKQRHAGENRVCRVVVAQPRKISAISVAERIAQERGEKLGDSVGYQVRLQKVLPTAEQCIVLCTTAIALKYLDNDDTLAEMTHLVIDEAHERSIESDLLIALAREKMQRLPHFKVIVMSATIQEHLFSSYLSGCRIVEIESKMYPVQEMFLEDLSLIPHPERLETSTKSPDFRQFPLTAGDVDALEGHPDLWCAALGIALSHLDTGSVLMFFSGWKEMKAVREEIECRPNFRHCRVFCLHSSVSNDEQMRAFRPAAQGERKVVLATNIAETSITIEDVTIVIDSGKEKTKRFDVNTKSFTLMPHWISKTSAVQRIGRAGRVRPGLCYRMYTRAQFQRLEDHALPEIRRLPLENLVLQVKLLVPHENVQTFIGRLIEPPRPQAVQEAIHSLNRMRALYNDLQTLTPLGETMARLPLDAHVAKLLCLARVLGCQEPVLSIAAAMSVKDPFLKVEAPAFGEAAPSQRKKFGHRFRSDSAALAEAVDAYTRVPDPYGFCRFENISISAMRQIVSIREQLRNYIGDTDISELRNPRPLHPPPPPPQPGHDQPRHAHMAILKACLAAALYPNLARVPRGPGGEPIKTRKVLDCSTGMPYTVLIHPSSTNNKEVLPADFLVYLEQVETTAKFVRGTTCVPTLAVALFAGNKLEEWQVQDHGGMNVSVHFVLDRNSALEMRASIELFPLIKRAREVVDKLLECMLAPGYHPPPTLQQAFEYFLDVLAHILTLPEDAPPHGSGPLRRF